MLKAVLMDIDDTLLDFGKCAEQAMRIGFAEWGLPYDDSTYATFTRINDSLWLMIERGELTTQQLFEFRWNRIFGPSASRPTAPRLKKRFLDLLYETAIPVDGADEICRYLKEKYILCAASNAFHDQQLNRLEMAGLLPYFDHVFVSESLGYRKPEKAFFDACRAFSSRCCRGRVHDDWRLADRRHHRRQKRGHENDLVQPHAPPCSGALRGRPDRRFAAQIKEPAVI